jgi:hypothetical protein
MVLFSKYSVQIANSPQIQLAEDTAAALNQGKKPNSLISGNVNINNSLAPFVIIYDKSGNIVSGSGYLNGHIPVVPYGVLTSSNNQDYSWVSWQPASNVRIASVSVSANKYYVLSGRSLKQVEINENHVLQISFLGGIISLIVLAITFLMSESKHKK